MKYTDPAMSQAERGHIAAIAFPLVALIWRTKLLNDEVIYLICAIVSVVLWVMVQYAAFEYHRKHRPS